MRHISQSNKHHREPRTPDFDTHSKILVMIMLFIHPFLAFICLESARVLAKLTSDFLEFLSRIYAHSDGLKDFDFKAYSESEVPYITYLCVGLLLVALTAANFRMFRYKKFWPNFCISICLLFIGLLIFAPELFVPAF